MPFNDAFSKNKESCKDSHEIHPEIYKVREGISKGSPPSLLRAGHIAKICVVYTSNWLAFVSCSGYHPSKPTKP